MDSRAMALGLEREDSDYEDWEADAASISRKLRSRELGRLEKQRLRAYLDEWELKLR